MTSMHADERGDKPADERADDQGASQPAGQFARQLAGGPRDAARPPCVDSRQLFEGQRELIILHQGEQYRLRITRQEKLILTK